MTTERFEAAAKVISDGLDRRDALITELSRALRDLLELVQTHGIEPCGDVPMHEFDAIVDGAVHDARKALGKAFTELEPA